MNRTALTDRYLGAKETVIDRGFASEIDWQDSIDFYGITESDFLGEAAWVILSSGMREATIRRKFPEASKAFLDWRSAKEIILKRHLCYQRALTAFAHEGKIKAILHVAETVADMGFKAVREEIRKRDVAFLQEFPYLGPATSYHLAKNLGLNVVKPDRHLVRVSKTLGFDSPRALCQAIADSTGDKASVVDLVIWRFATIEKAYLAYFGNICPSASNPSRQRQHWFKQPACSTVTILPQ